MTKLPPTQADIEVTSADETDRSHADNTLASQATTFPSVHYVVSQTEDSNLENVFRHGPDSNSSYGTNPYPGVVFDNSGSNSRQVSGASQAPGTSFMTNRLGEIDSSGHQNPAVGAFASQEWVPPYGPFLDFAPQPVYEPTGELAREQIDTFEEFDNPPLRSTSSFSQSHPTVPYTATSDPSSSIDPPPLKATFAPPPPLKSVLKRKSESESASTRIFEGTKRQESVDSTTGRTRNVSFGRMSNSSVSPSGEGLPSPDLTANEPTVRSATAPGGKAKSQKPVEHAPQNHTSAKVPPGTGRSSARISGLLYKGDLSSASMLPAEKVFPIQIGSELFRLSGASISSDGLYPTYPYCSFES